VVMSPPPIFAEYLLDRYLVAAELLNIKPMVVLNKVDLLTDATRPKALERLDPYRHIPSCSVALCSTVESGGLDEVIDKLCGKTAVLVGPSGVGKSSIIAALGCEDTIRVGDVSPRGAGKHTTTATRLYHLPKGGHLIDSPGVRDFNLWDIKKEDVLRGFREFESYIESGSCRFRDCQHRQEPGCRVQEAMADGKISPKRFASYLELMREVSLIKKQY